MAPPMVSVIYDRHDDRLHLFLTTQEQEQFEGVITRRLFKVLLKSLPNWLAQQTGPVQSATTAVSAKTKVTAQQRAVNQFDYDNAQAIAEKKQDFKIKTERDAFLVVQIAFSMKQRIDNVQQLQLVLASKDKRQNITLSLTMEQLYKLVGVMLQKAADWDLSNPWTTLGFNHEYQHVEQLH